MSPPPARETRPTSSQSAPFSRDAEAEAVAMTCTRFLWSHGRRRASEWLELIPPDTAIDIYGVGGVVRDLEVRVAELLAKPATLFLPTGTMAQQIVLRVHGERRGAKSVAFHPACHLDSHEERGYQQLHGLFAIPVGSRNEPLSLASLERVHEPVGSLLIELPQRDLGGTLPKWDELTSQVEWARARGAAVHLDGARLWEATPYYRKTLSEVAALFDTVYVSFYKGLGGLTGCCVTGEEDVIDEVSTWRTRHGGRLVAMWPFAAAAMSALDRRLPMMPRYHRHAVAIGRALKDVPGVEVLPYPVQSAMMHLRLSVGRKELRDRALAIARRDGVWTFASPFVSEGPRLQRVELPVGDATLQLKPDEIRSLISRLVNADDQSTRRSPKRAPIATKRARR